MKNHLSSLINQKLKKQLIDDEKIIFIRHAYEPGNGDPINFI